MKHWPSQLFPLILLAMLAGLTFWLKSAVDRESPASNGKQRHDPDAIAENFVVRRFDAGGQVKYRLSAPRLVHYPDDDSSEIDGPHLFAFQPGAPDLEASARTARVLAKGDSVLLRQDVTLQRAATGGRPPLIARMPELLIHPEAGTAQTGGPVDIEYGASTLQGVGMQFDNNASTLVLQSQVRGRYIPPRAQP